MSKFHKIAPCDDGAVSQTRPIKAAQGGAFTIAVSGVHGGAGTTQTAVNLAATLALAGHRTTIVDLSFGSRPATTFLGADRPAQTLSDFLSGTIPSLQAAVEPTAYPRLSFIESGIEFLNFTDKSLRLKKNLIKKLGLLDGDYVVIDLGLIADHVRLDYFLGADAALAVTSAEESAAERFERFAASLTLRAAEAASRKSQPLKKAVDRLRGVPPTARLSLIANLKASDGIDTDTASKLDKIATTTKLNLVVNKAATEKDSRFGPDLVQQINATVGIPIISHQGLPLDQTTEESARDRVPLPFLGIHSPAVQALRHLAERLTNVSFDDVTKEASKHMLAHAIERRTSTFGKQLEKRKEDALRAHKNELGREINIERKKALGLLEEELQKENIERRAAAEKTLSTEMAQLESERRAIVESNIRETERLLLATLDREMNLRRQGKSAQLDGEIDLIRQKRIDELEDEMNAEKSRSMEEHKKREQQRTARMERDLAETAERLREEQREECRGEINHVREVVWQELEENREKKIKTIAEEISLMRNEGFGAATTEMEEYRQRKRQEAEQEANAIRQPLIDQAHRDVMIISGRFDEERAKKEESQKLALQTGLDLERNVALRRLQHDLSCLRKKQMAEQETGLEKMRATRLAHIEKEIKLSALKARKTFLKRLKEEIAEQRNRVHAALSDYESKSQKKIDLKRESLLLNLQQEILDRKASQIAAITQEVALLEKSQKTEMNERLATEEDLLRKEQDQRIRAENEERKAIIKTKLAEERQVRLADLDTFIGHRRGELLAELTNELGDHRQKALETIEAEMGSLRAEKLSAIAGGIEAERKRQIQLLEDSLQHEEQMLRQATSDRMVAEEQAVREQIGHQLDQERKNLRQELHKELQPELQRMRAEHSETLEQHRLAAYETLRTELAALRQRSAGKIHAWETAEQQKRLGLINARLDEEFRMREAVIDSSLAARRKNEMEQIQVEMKKEQAQNSRQLKRQTEADKRSLLDSVRMEVATEKERLLTRIQSEIDIERERLVKEQLAELSRIKARKLRDVSAVIEQERIERHREITIEVAESRTRLLEEIEKETANAHAAMDESLENRRLRLTRKQEEWIVYEGDRLRVEVKEEIARERDEALIAQRQELDKTFDTEKEKQERRAEQDAVHYQNRLEQRIHSEIEIKRGALLEAARKNIKVVAQQEREAMIRRIKRKRLELLEKIDQEAQKAKAERIRFIEKQLDVERCKKFEALDMEIKTEEYRRRQELITDIMEKKVSLDRSFRDEKERSFQQLRDELLQNAHGNRELFEMEIQRIAKSLRHN